MTQDIQYGTENTNLLQEALHEIPLGSAQDRFMWNLVGIALCYLESDTLKKCIEVARKGYGVKV